MSSEEDARKKARFITHLHCSYSVAVVYMQGVILGA